MQLNLHSFTNKKFFIKFLIILLFIGILGYGGFLLSKKYFCDQNRVTTIEFFDDYNVSNNEIEVFLLCYIAPAKDQLGKCLNTKKNIFEYITIQDVSEYSLNDNIDSYAKSIQLLLLNSSVKEISIIFEDNFNYEEGLINLLDSPNLEDFIINNSSNTEEVYLDFYDLISVYSTLLRYYGELNRGEKTVSLIEEIKDFVYQYKQNNLNYILLYPANGYDIEYIKDIDFDLGSDLEEISDLQVDYIYENILFLMDKEEFKSVDTDFDSSSFSEFIDLYKGQSFLSINSDLYNEYDVIFNEYRDFLFKKFDFTRENLEIWVRYIPTEDPDILEYFLKIYSEDERSFYKELIKTDFYIADKNFKSVAKYKMSNIVYNNLTNVD